MGDEYLESYGDVSVHRLMLNDKPRTNAYKDAIFGNKSAIAGKVVMDVGCGTGILSVFCAQAGAAKVHAVESSSVAKLAKKVVKDNGFESVIQVHETSVENLVLDEKVDMIVSEWMGFYLLHEGMLESVLYARDKFLAPGGLMFPQTAALYVAGCQLPEYFDFWNDVYGVNMASVGDADRQQTQEPVVKIVKAESLITEPEVVAWLNLEDTTIDEIRRISKKIVKPAVKDGKWQGICFWFDVTFPEGEQDYCLSTAPDQAETHWQQTAVVLPTEYPLFESNAIAFEVTLECRTDDPRKYNIEVNILDPDKEEHNIPCDCDSMKCVIIKAHLERTADNGIEDEYVESEEDEEKED